MEQPPHPPRVSIDPIDAAAMVGATVGAILGALDGLKAGILSATLLATFTTFCGYYTGAFIGTLLCALFQGPIPRAVGWCFLLALILSCLAWLFGDGVVRAG